MATPETKHPAGTCGCISCAANRPFEMPEALATACLEGELVVFAGAGVSTENRLDLPYSFYDEIRAELDVDHAADLSFPATMSAFEAKHGRVALLERIKKRLDYVKSFPNIDGEAGRFAAELSSVFTVDEIVTTNWDDYFERECGAQPFVTEQDWVFAKSSDRKVFKLHGSIANPGSIVATDADYRHCYRNLNQGLAGAELKRMLATKTVVFIGYSLKDADFVRLYGLMQRRMQNLLPRSYVVTLDDGEPPKVAAGMHVIRTSGVNFVRELKKEFSEDELVPDERFDAIPAMREFVSMLHHHMIDQGEMREDPAMLICACYQDGLLDALDHQRANKAGGKYSHRCYTAGLVNDTYERMYQERLTAKRWTDVAYIEGYRNGLTFLVADDELRKKRPLYFIFGDEPLRTYEEYAESARYFRTLNREAFEHAKEQAARLAPGVVFQHTPTLLL